ncbi:carboxymuconolactone decarboxylase family protein [Parasulfitobacter algicola]|uniref:Carboxymuconolactone decarboxylase family protein n=1 Tax=Parasulfitobacter algicola TaxID=2614809 RepID=A0ABX2IWX7_9RHOB|nr:carboxymuconolactone decarboxylase family protein [Sulfitobacter algicola]NSX56606.1 carboxymuconolactone decarboxylase family protein [Sulfitobacter algicola]
MTSDAYQRGKAKAEATNPGIEETLRDRYDDLLPGFSKTMMEVPFGHYYTRGVLDDKTRYLTTVAALTALGGQTAPQLKVHIRNALRSGATKYEVAEVINQMALYGGFPAMINALNAAIEVFEAEETSDD